MTFDHNPATCRRDPCGKCRGSGEPNPPKPIDHQVQKPRAPRGRRELDLGRLLQQVGRRVEDEGQAASQHFYEWEREAKIPPTPPACPVCDGAGCRDCNGTGDARPASDGALKQRQEAEAASRLRDEWRKVRVQIEALANRADWLLDQARVLATGGLDKHRTPAQVEADGWCGNCWARGGFLVPISLRPTGEPYYKGRCRPCGQWPGGNPPKEVVEARNSKGKDLKVRAS